MKETLHQLHLSDDNLVAIMNQMLVEMRKGLAKETNPSAKVKMIPSYVESLPDGTGMLSQLHILTITCKNFHNLLILHCLSPQ